MLRRHIEIWSALAVIVVVSAIYAFAYRFDGALPKASGIVGHGIGVIGFLLMLVTEAAYSIRKQVTDASWGAIATWLRLHIATGLVGPYMVLLHTSMRFHGLAGVAMLLTVAVVMSGIVGRYIYTRLPRATDATSVAKRAALATWHSFHVPLTWVLFAAAFAHSVAALVYATLQR